MVEAAGYALTIVSYLLLTLLLVTSYRQRLRSVFLSLATVATTAWAAIYLSASFTGPLSGFQVFLLEFLLDGAWLIFLASLMGGGIGGASFRVLRRVGLAGCGMIVLAGCVLEYQFRHGQIAEGAEQLLVFGQVLTSLLVLIYVEQIIRNARDQQRRGLKYLCLALVAAYVYDLLMYSYAIVDGRIGTALWQARSYVWALCAPLFVVAVNRTPTWSGGIFVSRQVVFHTATVFSAGLYLTAIGLAGQYLRQFGGRWGDVAQVVLVAAALMTLGVLLFSEQVRARLRVFISKHFYRNKYDYREEWLRLTQTMTEEGLPLQKRSVKAIADIVSAPTGYLWLQSDLDSDYRLVATWNVARPDAQIPAFAELPRFMRETDWIVDLEEYERDPARYEGFTFERNDLAATDVRFVVPLVFDTELTGFIALSMAPGQELLNYEDRDLLKTAGRQVASYIAQEQATELLTQSRQFEAFNKLTAFLMHDLKNVIAQQSLLVENAVKHRNNPEFVDDAIETIRSGVLRMRRVIDQLRQDSAHQSTQKVELGKLIITVVSECADRRPEPRARIGSERAWVRAESDRLQMAIYHLLRNAQDATPGDGEVTVELRDAGSDYLVVVTDSGAGMDEQFIRERLFRPFDSTKGTQGMGIGAYQVRESVRGMGGSVSVESMPGKGTRVTLRLPKVVGSADD